MTARRAQRGCLALAAVVALSGCASLRADSLEEPQAAAQAARAGGTVRVAVTTPETLDPAVAGDPASLMVTSLLCEPLLQRDPRTGELRPGLVMRWLITDRGQRITLSLRRDLEFPDGSDLTAEDVAATFSRVANVDTASPYAERLSGIEGYDTVHGEKETSVSLLKRRLSGFSATDTYSIEITLTQGDPGFLSLLTETFTSPLPSELADPRRPRAEVDAELERDPACIGPYRLAQPWPGSGDLSLVQNEDYYAKGVGWTNGGRGYAAGFDFVAVANAAQARKAFAEGKVELAAVPAADVPAARRLPGASVVSVPTEEVEYLGLPVTVEPYAEVDVRRAVSLAVDRTALAQKAYGGTRTPATSLISPAVGGAYADTDCEDAPAAAAPDRARALLAERGEPLAPLTLTVNDEYGHGQMADVVAAQLRANLGVKVTVQRLPWPEYLALGTAPPGFQSMFRTSWTPERPDAEAVVDALFTPQSGGTSNLSGYEEPDVQKFLERRARRAEDVRDAEAEYSALLKRLCDDLPLVPLLQGARSYLVKQPALASTLEGWGTSDGLIALREVYLAGGAG